MAHNRSVLKERRIHPGALTCFAVAECQGWRWGSVPRRGSAGPVLRSQVSSRGDGAFALRARERGVRFQCSLRTDPAVARSALSNPLPGHRRRGRSLALRYLRVLSPISRCQSAGAGARDRSCARRERWGRLGFRAVARWGSGCRRSCARSGPVPLPLGCLGACPQWGWFDGRR